MEMNRKSYNKIVDQWHESRKSSPMNKCAADFISKIKPNGRVLDIGCGTGYPILKSLAEQGFFAVGIDISEGMISKAKELNLPNTELYLCDFFEYQPFGKFDGIIAFDSFFHFPKERQAEIYARAAGWMNIGGYLLFTHGKSEGAHEGYMYGAPFYYSSLCAADVHKLLIESGFAVEASKEDYKEATTGERDLLVVAKKIR